MRVAALVLAAGRGERLGARVPKAFVELGGRSLIERSIDTLNAVPGIDRVVAVVPADRLGDWPGAVAGGAERQDSVRAGLEVLGDDFDWVAVHDAARCLVSGEEVAAVVATAQESGAAILARPSADTVKLVSGDHITSTPDRSTCWIAQTPQVFRTDLLREALDKADADGFVATDDAQLVERLGVPVRVVVGSSRNFKITRAEDLEVAKALLS